MGRQKLDSKIFSKLKKRFSTKTDNAIRVKISKLSRKEGVSLNAAAELWGRKDGFSVWGILDEKDRGHFGDKEIKVIKLKSSFKKKSKVRALIFINFKTENKFLKLHIDEINRAYNAECYTSVFILIRKVLENLIVEIVKKKFPGRSKKNKELYLDLSRGRTLDLSVVIDNLKKASKQFDADEKKLIQRILQKASEFKDDANDKTHSLYHLSNKTELKGKEPQMTFYLIEEFFEKY